MVLIKLVNGLSLFFGISYDSSLVDGNIFSVGFPVFANTCTCDLKILYAKSNLLGRELFFRASPLLLFRDIANLFNENTYGRSLVVNDMGKIPCYALAVLSLCWGCTVAFCFVLFAYIQI